MDGEIPGDRKSDCNGKMYPTMYKISNWEMKILFECSKCWKRHWNKRAEDDEIIDLDGKIREYKEHTL